MSNNVIFVSNSPTVLEKKLGNKIDQFDTVIRINDFEIEGYEEHVGTKTDIWASCSSPPNVSHMPLMRIFNWMNYYSGKFKPFKEIWTVRENHSDNLFLDNCDELPPFYNNDTQYRFMHMLYPQTSQSGNLSDYEYDGPSRVDDDHPWDPNTPLVWASDFVQEKLSSLQPSSNGRISPGTGILVILNAVEKFGKITMYGNSFFKDIESKKAGGLGKHYFTMNISRYIGTTREKYFFTQLDRESEYVSPILDYNTENKITEDLINEGRIEILE